MGVHGSTTAIITMMMVMMVTVTVMVAVTVMVMTMVVPAFVGYMPDQLLLGTCRMRSHTHHPISTSPTNLTHRFSS